MTKIAIFFVGLTALAQVVFLILEMFFWDKPPGFAVFKHPDLKQLGLEQPSLNQSDLLKESDLKQPGLIYATITKTLAMNQGLYNGFLAAGLAWGLCPRTAGHDIQIFFLVCVVIAGVYGAVTLRKPPILFVQALPAAIALALVILS